MRNVCLAVLTASAAAACSGGGSSGDPTTTEEPPASTSTTPPPPPATTTPPGTKPDPTPIAKNLGLSAVSFKQTGRKGDTLLVEIEGADSTKKTSAAMIRFLDDADEPVVALDTDWDGTADAAERRFHFDASTAGKATFTGEITIANVFAIGSKIAKVGVRLEDETGGRSAEITAPLALQEVKGENDTCDAAQIADRCQAGLGCTGTPAACRPGVAPAVTKVAYFGGSVPRMLFLGTDPDEDQSHITLEFLNGAGQPLAVDLNDDGSTTTGFELDASKAPGRTFFLQNDPVASFAQLVPKIGVTMSDLAGNTSARSVVAITSPTPRSVGQSCDFNGFDSCGPSNVCAPGLPSATNLCKARTTLQTQSCKDAPVLDPAKGPTFAFGTVAGASLWDAPTGCVTNDAVGRPDAVVKLHLAAAAKSLVITTEVPETDFDTAIFMMPACPTTSATSLGCNDDSKGFASSLTLANVPAGDYSIVVESVKPGGGRFGLSVSATSK